MDTPSLIIDGKEYFMPEPKIKLWRKFIRYYEKFGERSNSEEAYTEMLDIIATAFNNPEITPEVVEDNGNLKDLTIYFDYIKSKVTGTANAKAGQVPNVKAPSKT